MKSPFLRFPFFSRAIRYGLLVTLAQSTPCIAA